MGSQVLLTTRWPHAQRRCRQGAAGGVGPRVRKFSLKRPPKPGAQCAAHPSRLPSRPWELSRFPLPPWPGSGTVVGFPAFSFLILAHLGSTMCMRTRTEKGASAGRRSPHLFFRVFGLLRFHLFISQSARVKWAPLHPVTWMDEAPYDC